MTLTPLEIALIAILALVLAGIVFALLIRNRRRAELKSHFGPEYRRVVHNIGDEAKAETILQKRQKRVDSYHIKDLSPEMRSNFVELWRQVQGQFVDDPELAVRRADDLLGEVMVERGYPMREFEQRANDLSVEHPQVVQNYRVAHEIAIRHEQGEASTEDLRVAIIHFRALFDELVGDPEHIQPNAMEKTSGRAAR